MLLEEESKRIIETCYGGEIMGDYLIRDKDGVTIGRFQDKKDRDAALTKFCNHGFPADE